MVARNPGEVELMAVVAETPKAPSPLRDWLRGGTEELEGGATMLWVGGLELEIDDDGIRV
jgi:hypothetical protein